MRRTRWAALVVAVVLTLTAGFNSHLAVPTPHATQETAAGDRSGSILPGVASPDLSFTAVEPGRAMALVRSETRQGSWVLSSALLAVALLAAGSLGRSPSRWRRVLELSIRAQTEWWRPTPGGRAPPRALPL